MMDKAYILENGIIELYVLGELNNDEVLSVESLLLEDKELKAAFDSIEANFETLALENAILPPKRIKDNLLNTIGTTPTKVLPITTKNPFKSYLAIAASIAALLCIGSIWLYTQWNDAKQQLQMATEQNSSLIKDLESANSTLANASEYLAVLNSTETQQYVLKGNSLSPEAKLISYVNHAQKKVIVNAAELPELDENHDYQMWADVEGEMINMGVISKDAKLLAMNYIDNAESLNVTIEPSGGNDHPTVSRLITNVYL